MNTQKIKSSTWCVCAHLFLLFLLLMKGFKKSSWSGGVVEHGLQLTWIQILGIRVLKLYVRSPLFVTRSCMNDQNHVSS